MEEVIKYCGHSKDDILDIKVVYDGIMGHVYFLTYKGLVMYVGKAENGWYTRVMMHRLDKLFDSVSYIECPKLLLEKVEQHYIEKLSPFYNGTGNASPLIPRLTYSYKNGVLLFNGGGSCERRVIYVKDGNIFSTRTNSLIGTTINNIGYITINGYIYECIGGFVKRISPPRHGYNVDFHLQEVVSFIPKTPFDAYIMAKAQGYGVEWANKKIENLGFSTEHLFLYKKIAELKQVIIKKEKGYTRTNRGPIND